MLSLVWYVIELSLPGINVRQREGYRIANSRFGVNLPKKKPKKKNKHCLELVHRKEYGKLEDKDSRRQYVRDIGREGWKCCGW